MPGFYLPTENEFDPSTDDFVLPAISKERRYKHFDLPLSESERELAIDFTQESEPRRFLPMLGFTDLDRRFIRQKDANGDWLRDADGNFIRKVKEKRRPIRFAGHADALPAPLACPNRGSFRGVNLACLKLSNTPKSAPGMPSTSLNPDAQDAEHFIGSICYGVVCLMSSRHHVSKD